MNVPGARRGTHRIRIALAVGPRSASVAGMWALDGPAVQRPALDGTHLAEVRVGGAIVLLQSFDDPLQVRGAARRGEPGHSYSQVEQAIVHVDVPLAAGEFPGEIAIRLVDLSNVRRRPTDAEGVQNLLEAASPPRGLRAIAEITAAELVAHPEWAALGLPGAAPLPPAGSFEIYLDRAGKHRWRLRGPGGEIIAASGQAYRDRAACEADVRWIKQHGTDAPVQARDAP